MKVEHSIGKHTFNIVGDVEEILKGIEKERKHFEEEHYVEYLKTWDDGHIGEKEYQQNIDKFEHNVLELLENESELVGLIEKAQKKKNGTFYKNRVVEEIGCNNSIFITEWHNTWIYSIVKVKAVSDNILEIMFDKKTDTPG